MTKTEVKECIRCLFNTERVPNLTFEENGQCYYCKLHDQMEKDYPTGEEGWKILEELAEKIKRDGKNKKYDCIVGVSGGCDSSYLLYLAKVKLGLRPLAAHFDNTWNSRIAVENIQTMLKKLDIDLYTYVMDNEEFSDMAKSILKASVPEIDSLTDIALATTLYMAADKYDIKYILEGHNFRTEGTMPLNLFYFDGKYIQDIHKKYGTMKMKRYPNLWLSKWMFWLFKGIKKVRPLYNIQYNKEEIKKFLTKEYDWQWYGGQHLENRYTKFYHYLNTAKFGIDHRYVEYSALIRSRAITKDEALKMITGKKVNDGEDIIKEVKKRLNLTDKEYEDLISQPKRTHKEFKTYHNTFKRLKPLFWLMYKKKLVTRTFYEKYTK